MFIVAKAVSSHSVRHVSLRCGGVLWWHSGLAMNHNHPLSPSADGREGMGGVSASRYRFRLCFVFHSHLLPDMKRV